MRAVLIGTVACTFMVVFARAQEEPAVEDTEDAPAVDADEDAGADTAAAAINTAFPSPDMSEVEGVASASGSAMSASMSASMLASVSGAIPSSMASLSGHAVSSNIAQPSTVHKESAATHTTAGITMAMVAAGLVAFNL
ncbi:hypothetical protein INT43_000999 [Umbelopsis isabellina]|uniref:Uncharacterized protein n=1 Tax=Mortierella isabellina TaxID=91625 RepID=A0A8H7Q5I5_MORIS|nr:hypothetical protein INT43_000999 [Umbelopsis isabellina]